MRCNNITNNFILNHIIIILNNIPFINFRKVADYIFNSNINDINYIVEEDIVHLSKLTKVNIENKMIEINEKTHLNNEIRNSVYNELIKTTKISTNDKLINAILNSY